MTATLTPSAMSDLAFRQRIEARAYGYDLDMPREMQPVPAFDPMVRQADVIGACTVVNRYRCHGPVLTRAIAAYNFFGSGSLPALAVAVGLASVVMAAVK